MRTILKGYANKLNKLTGIKDYFSKNGKEHLDSDRQFYYDDAANLLKEEELVMNADSTSNTNSGTLQYCYNKQRLQSQAEDPGIVHLFKYYPNGLLSKWSAFFKNIASQWGSNIFTVTKNQVYVLLKTGPSKCRNCFTIYILLYPG